MEEKGLSVFLLLIGWAVVGEKETFLLSKVQASRPPARPRLLLHGLSLRTGQPRGTCSLQLSQGLRLSNSTPGLFCCSVPYPESCSLLPSVTDSGLHTLNKCRQQLSQVFCPHCQDRALASCFQCSARGVQARA